MKKSFVTVLGASVFLTAFVSVASAYIPAVYTNDNFFSSEHDEPVSFTQDEKGDFTGFTKTGKIFRQYQVANYLSIRLQKFEIDEAYFYISDHGVILAQSDTVALSIYLTRLG